MTRATRRGLGKIARDNRGNVAVLTAFAIVPLITVMAGVLNFGMAWTMRNDLQYTADAAALAGASQLGNDANVLAKANEFAAQNMAPTNHGDVLADADIEIGHWDSATRTFAVGAPKDAVRVTTRRTEATGNSVPIFLGNLMGRDHWDLTTTAIAALHTEGEGCLLALDPTAKGAFEISGSAVLTLNGCSAMSNSTDKQAFNVTGSGVGTMLCAYAVGTVSVGGSGDLNLTDPACQTAQSNVPTPAPDPYANLPEPPVTGPCKSLPNGQGFVNISPGRFCNGGSLKGSKNFQPGVYVMDGGTFKISAQANITGSDVTFFLTNNATVDFDANGKMTLSAPTTGTYSGVLFFGDKDNTNNTNKFNGTPTSTLTGALYFPNQTVQYLGNFSGVNGCMRVVARIIDFRGNTGISITCPNLAGFNLVKKLTLVD